MDQVRNVSDEYNNIFTVYDDMDIAILHIIIKYKHDLFIYGYISQLYYIICFNRMTYF